MQKLFYSFLLFSMFSFAHGQTVPNNLKDKDFVFQMVLGGAWNYSFTPCTIGLDEGDTVIIWTKAKDPAAGTRVPEGTEMVLGVSTIASNDIADCVNWSDSDDEDQLALISKNILLERYFSKTAPNPMNTNYNPTRVTFTLQSGHLKINSWAAGLGRSVDISPLPSLGDSWAPEPFAYLSITIHFNVLRRNVHPPTILTEMSFFNGINRFVPFGNFIDGAPADTITAREDQSHPSVIRTAYTNGEFRVMLGDTPINEAGEAIYTLTATNGYGTSEAEVHLKLFSASINVGTAPNGMVDPSGIIGGTPGSTLEITASPTANYQFDGWEGDVALENVNDNPLILTFPETAQISVTPKFAVKPYVEMFAVSLDFSPEQGYLVTVVDEERTQYTELPATGLEYEKNTVLKLKAVPKMGYEFTQWIGDVSVAQYANAEISIVLSKDMTFGAVFKKEESTTTPTPTYTTNLVPTATTPTTTSGLSPELLSLLSSRSTQVSGASAFTPSSSGKSGFGSSSPASHQSYQNALSAFGLGGISEGGEGSSSSYSLRRSFRDGYIFQYKPYLNNASGDYYYSNDQVEAARESGLYGPVTSLFENLFSGAIGGGRLGH